MLQTRWTRRRLVLAKLETTIGTDARPQVSSDTLKVTDLEMVPLQSDELNGQALQPYFGTRKGLKTHKRSSLRFGMHFAGSGNGATPPHYGILLQSCGLTQTIVPDQSNQGAPQESNFVSYTPTSSDVKTLTLYCNYDGRIHAVTGARGTVGLRVTANDLPEWHFSFLGHYVRPVLATRTTSIVYPAEEEISLPSTPPVVHCGGKTMMVARLEVDLGADIEYIGWLNGAQIEMLDRQVEGRMVVRDDDPDTDFWFRKLDQSETVTLSFVQEGIKFTAPRVQIADVGYENVNGIQALGMDLRFLPMSGDDEITFEIR